MHVLERRSRTDEGAVQWQRVALFPCHGDPDEIAISRDGVGGVEIDPSGARQIRLHPAVRVSTANRRGAAHLRYEDVAAHETRRDADRTDGFHHEHRKVAAAAAAAL